MEESEIFTALQTLLEAPCYKKVLLSKRDALKPKKEEEVRDETIFGTTIPSIRTRQQQEKKVELHFDEVTPSILKMRFCSHSFMVPETEQYWVPF